MKMTSKLLASAALLMLAATPALADEPFQVAQIIGSGIFGVSKVGGGGGGSTCPTTPSLCMTAPIFFSGSGTASASLTQYDVLNAGSQGQSWSGTEGTHRHAMATVGQFQNLAAATVTAFTSGGETADIIKNAAGGVLTCGFSTVAGTTSCVDTTHVVSGSPIGNSGNPDYFAVRSTPATLSNAIMLYQGMEYVDQTSVGNEAPIFVGGWSSGTVAAGQFIGFGAAMTPNATEINISSVMPGDVCDGSTTVGTIDNLTIQATTASASGVWGLFLTVNGVDTAVECDIASSTTFCKPLDSSSVAIKCGDTLSIHATQKSGTVTASVLSGSVRWRPVVAGQYPIFGIGGSLSTASPRYTSISGNFGIYSGTENANYSLMPATNSYKFSDLLYVVSAVNGTGQRTVTLASGTSATFLGTTAGSPTAQASSTNTFTLGGGQGTFPGHIDLTHSLTMSASTAATPQFLDLQHTLANSPLTATWAKISMMVQKQ